MSRTKEYLWMKDNKSKDKRLKIKILGILEPHNHGSDKSFVYTSFVFALP
ncbi:MAG: hypothetical protein JWR38_2152 [Mucilaginibacter sp.]|nr:hypothetical protein [Mucilaginibacter sp.]